MRSDALGALTNHPLFEVLPKPTLAAVLDVPATVTFEAGQMLFRQGDPARRLYLVVEGQVDLVITPPGRSPELLTRLSEGELVGADSIMPGSRHAATARAVAPTLAVVVLGERLIAHFESHFEQAVGIIGGMAGSLRGQIKEITELKLQSTTERLASYLAELAGGGGGRAVVRLPCEKRFLADRLGMEPATLSRAFAKLREMGVETGRGDRVEIADVAILRRLSESLDMVCEGAAE